MSKTFKKVVDSAKGFACGLYKQQPKALIPNVADDTLRFVWDNLCDPPSPDPTVPPLPGLPPPPAPLPGGGQCVCVKYRVRLKYYWRPSGVNGVLEPIEQVFEMWGPILDVGRDTTQPYGIRFSCRGPGSGTCKTPGWYNLGGGSNTQQGPYQIIGIARVDNATDNCGNSPPVYPGVDPTPSGGFNSPITTIKLGDTTNLNVTFNLTPPVRPPSGIGIPPVIVNVTNPNLNFPISFNFDGTVNIGSPGGGTPTLPPGVEDKINNINDKTDNININLDDFLKDWNFNTNPPPYATDPEVDAAPGDGEGNGEEDKEGLLGVKITLTKFPDKAQFGNPTVFFAGWLTFKLQDGHTERKQINFENSYFEAPPGASGYAYTLTNGSEGEVTVYSKKAEA